MNPGPLPIPWLSGHPLPVDEINANELCEKWVPAENPI